MSRVETTELAPGLRISRVLNGLWQIADVERDGNTVSADSAVRFMRPYVEAGFTSFDMADHYGSAEEMAGAFRVADEASLAQMLTKWVPPPGPLDAECVREAVERALRRLQTDCIDLMQFHAWHYPDPAWLDGLACLAELRDQGLIRHIGLTNFDAAHLRVAAATGFGVVSNQVSYSLLDRRAAGAMTEVCQAFGIGLLAYGTLAGGLISERWLGQEDPGEPATWSQMKYLRFIRAAGGWKAFQRVLEAVKDVADKHGVSMAAIASRHVLDRPAVAGVIIGARPGHDHFDENLAIFETRMDDEDRSHIAAALDRLNDIPGDCGDEYRKPPFLTASGDLSDHLDEIPPVFAAIEDESGRRRVFSGTPWEAFAGYCRAVRHGNGIHVSGTTATHGARIIGGDDAAAQTHFVIDKIEAALESLGASLNDVVRTRVFVNDVADWEAVARAHGVRFAEIQPANTLVEARLVGEGYKVEIEADARLDGAS